MPFNMIFTIHGKQVGPNVVGPNAVGPNTIGPSMAAITTNINKLNSIRTIISTPKTSCGSCGH